MVHMASSSIITQAKAGADKMEHSSWAKALLGNKNAGAGMATGVGGYAVPLLLQGKTAGAALKQWR